MDVNQVDKMRAAGDCPSSCAIEVDLRQGATARSGKTFTTFSGTVCRVIHNGRTWLTPTPMSDDAVPAFFEMWRDWVGFQHAREDWPVF